MILEPMSEGRAQELRQVAAQVRRLVVKSVHHAGAGHLGGSLSAADLLTALYFEVLDIDPGDPRDPDRDRFVLSKGHASVGLYAALALRGFFPVEELETFDALDTRLQGHPDMSSLDCLDMSTGSLGQGLSAGVGMALAARLKGRGYHTWVLIGDGDAQEGQTWEAAFVAARYGLDNLTAVLDLNGLQQYGWSTGAGYGALDRQPAQENVAAKWRAFGWWVTEIDGHAIPEILEACARARTSEGQPGIIIARTVKGKGVSFMEGDYNWHAKPPADEDCRLALEELEDRGVSS